MVALATGPVSEITGRLVCEHLATGGKRLRARLALSAVEALGGEVAGAVGWAAACELLHNATLIHDDIQDGDRVRRNAPTVWARHGIPQALNAGDLMFLLPFEAIAQVAVSPAVRFALCGAIAGQGGDVIRGQGAEVELGGSSRISGNAGDLVDAYLRAIEGKTSALFELPVQGAALIAGLAADEVAGVQRPFHRLGMIFQLQDDVLDLYGDKGRDRPGSDLREGKISGMVVEHLALHPEDETWLTGLLRAPRDATPDDEVERAIDRFRDGGALRAVADRIGALTAEARAEPTLNGQPALRALLDDLMALILAPIDHVL